MPQHSEFRSVQYTSQQMYDLVADVAAYPEFLPWTSAARVRSVVPNGSSDVMTADLVISFKVFRERFTSRVVLWNQIKKIETEYLDGPFKYMHSQWVFQDTPSGCDMEFSVDFEFRNAVLQKVIGLVFDQAMRKVARAFEDRAAELYGPPNGKPGRVS